MSSPKRFEWVKMNLVGPDGAGDGRFYRTASGESTPDGVELGSFVQISERKTHRCTQSVVQCWRNRVQKTTRFLLGILQ